MLERLLCCRKRPRESQSLLPDQSPRLDFNCASCLQPTLGAMTASCGHLFCEKCLSEHLLAHSSCPACGEYIQRKPAYRCVQLDGIIDAAVRPEDRDIWRKRVGMHEDWIGKRRLSKVEVGLEIDVLDTEGVWCIGVIRLVVYSTDRYPVLKVHYLGWATRFDEFIPANSNRLGPKGFYTARARRKYLLREAQDNMSGVITHQ